MQRYLDREQRKTKLRDNMARYFRVVIRPERLQAMLTMAKWRHQDLADAVGMNVATVSRMVNGKTLPYYETLVAMSEALEKRLFELYGYDRNDIFNMLTQPKRERAAADPQAVERTERVKAAIRSKIRR